jgi:Mrp family chromosome partitioning ATPase
MGLLLKSLKQIDWRPAEAAADDQFAESAVISPVVETPEDLPNAMEEAIADEKTPQVAQEASEAQPIEQHPAEPPAGELPPPTEPAIQSAESTLDRLNELHELIDAALKDLPSSEPIVVESPAGEASIAEPAIASEQLDQPNRMIEFSPVNASTATVVPPPALPTPSVPLPPLRAAAPFVVPSFKIRDEYRELRDHLLARFRLDEPSTLLAIDAGRVTNDAAWLAPFAAALWESLSDEPMLHLSTPPRILLVEAAGAECGIARHLGLDCPKGLIDVLQGGADWADVIQRTYHPQIDLLCRGKAPLPANPSAKFVSVWTDLQRRYQAILVAAGPWEAPSQASWRKCGIATAAMLLPLADAAVVCVDLDGTPQSVAIETKRALDRRGIRLLGCVVRGQ